MPAKDLFGWLAGNKPSPNPDYRLLEPDLFPEQLQLDPQAAKAPEGVGMAMRLLTHFERRGFNLDMLNLFYPKIDEETGGNFA